jgi:hypothetical protein
MMILRLRPVSVETKSTLPREPLPDFEDYLQEFIDLARNNEIKLIAVGICAGRDYVDKLISVARNGNIAHIDFYEVIDDNVHNLSMVPFSDTELALYRGIYTREVLEQDPTLYLLFPDKCHPNPTGHRILALALRDRINEMGLLN